MSDLAIDLNANSPTYKDILVEDGDLVFTDDQGSDPGLLNSVLQDAVATLGVYLGEWFMDNTAGIDYFGSILVKNPDQAKIDAIILNALSNVPGVQTILSYSFSPDFVTRILRISFSLLTASGVVNYAGTVST